MVAFFQRHAAPESTLPVCHFIHIAHRNSSLAPFPNVKKKVDAGEKPFLLDTRGPDEFEQMRLGIGEHLIPLGALRNRLNELPADKNAEIICYCKISLRGYEAARVLEGHGWTNIKVMEGGVMAWPFPREK
ncbi:MAG: putative adenylyltransferase/sulfurtransferase MoeZ [Betaproteobacteria bacterium ADurb.Bin341]|nr:MAG: putative adenylyltransferase/sulfurtransferase MoeZ [Betaproteobacteria bacterium ADurb.Bin341]